MDAKTLVEKLIGQFVDIVTTGTKRQPFYGAGAAEILIGAIGLAYGLTDEQAGEWLVEQAQEIHASRG